VAAEAEELSVVFGNVNETGELVTIAKKSHIDYSDLPRYCRIDSWRWQWISHRPTWPRHRQPALS
jgi:hypothetical protein